MLSTKPARDLIDQHLANDEARDEWKRDIGNYWRELGLAHVIERPPDFQLSITASS